MYYLLQINKKYKDVILSHHMLICLAYPLDEVQLIKLALAKRMTAKKLGWVKQEAFKLAILSSRAATGF